MSAALRQQDFVNNELRHLEFTHISNLDYPDAHEFTLRKYLMSKTTPGSYTNRIIHNVDRSWQGANVHVVSTLRQFESAVNDIMCNMIPECIYEYPHMAKHWFTPKGIEVNIGQVWDPNKKRIKGQRSFQWESVLAEDPWGLKAMETSADEEQNEAVDLTTDKKKILNLPADGLPTGHRSECPSFGPLLGRDMENDTVDNSIEDTHNKEEPEKTIQFDVNVMDDDDKEKNPDDDGMSMSTAARTTQSTRVKYKKSQEMLVTSEKECKELAAKNDKLERMQETMERERQEMQQKIAQYEAMVAANMTNTTDTEADRVGGDD